MKVLSFLVASLALSLVTVSSQPSARAADDKEEAKKKKKKKDKKADKDKKDEKDKDKKADKKCSPTCTPTCDCSGNPIAAPKCSPTCTATCDCSGNPIAAPKCSPTCTATCDCSGNAIKCSPTCTASCDCSGNPTVAALTPEQKKENQKKNLAEFKAIAAAEREPQQTADIDELRKNRGDRRKDSVGRLRRRWGQLLADEKGAAELKRHSFRLAALQRIRVIAESKKDLKTVETVDELLTKEDERHFKAMNSLREGALPAVTK